MTGFIKKSIIAALAATAMLACCSCGRAASNSEAGDMKLKNVGTDANNIILLKENGEYAEYVAVDKDYDGKVLLIRRKPLEKKLAYRDSKVFGEGGSYYPGSDVDEFLNGEFFDSLDERTKELVEDCSIDVTSEDTVLRGDNRRNTESIIRKVFLLSATELQEVIGGSFMTTCEGT